MPDFLNRLAARALGALALAEPLVPARFDPGVEHVALTPFEQVNQPAPASEAIGESPARFFSRQTLVRSYRRAGSAVSSPLFGNLDDDSHSIRSQHQHRSSAENLQQQFTNEPRSWSDAQHAHLPASTLTPHSRTNETEAAVPGIADAKRASVLPLFAEPRSTLTESALKPDRVPGQKQQQKTSVSRHAPPTVRISIGRIEVRAELPVRVPAPASQRSRTSHVSLEQFLKQASGDTR